MITSSFFGKMLIGVTLPKKAEVRSISGLPARLKNLKLLKTSEKRPFHNLNETASDATSLWGFSSDVS